MTVGEGSGIFVSYRRQESSHLAGRLADRLADRFGEGQVFIDVDTIEPGVDFAEEIFRAVAGCEVLLAIIGPNWLASADERGGRRLDDPDDIVRLEIEAALARGVRVIPILIEGAVMPRRDDLPESLASLARRQALLIRHESFRYDVGHLVTAIERILTPASGPIAVPRASDAHGVRSAGNAYADDESDESNLEASGDRQLAFRGWTEEELERLSESPQASVQRVAKMLDLLSKSPGQPIAYTDLVESLHLTRGELQGALSGFSRWIHKYWGDDDGWPMDVSYRDAQTRDQASESYYTVTPDTADRWLAVRRRG